MRKHALNLFLIILLSLLLFGCSSGEEVGPGTTLISDDGLLTFTISDDGSYLTAENNTTDYSTGEPKTMPADYTIPASYKGIPVKQIGYFRSETLERIVIPEGVTTICGDFSQCPNLKEVVLPDSLEYIGDSAFQGCGSLSGSQGAVRAEGGGAGAGDDAVGVAVGDVRLAPVPGHIGERGNGALEQSPVKGAAGEGVGDHDAELGTGQGGGGIVVPVLVAAHDTQAGQEVDGFSVVDARLVPVARRAGADDHQADQHGGRQSQRQSSLEISHGFVPPF